MQSPKAFYKSFCNLNLLHISVMTVLSKRANEEKLAYLDNDTYPKRQILNKNRVFMSKAPNILKR